MRTPRHNQDLGDKLLHNNRVFHYYIEGERGNTSRRAGLYEPKLAPSNMINNLKATSTPMNARNSIYLRSKLKDGLFLNQESFLDQSLTNLHTPKVQRDVNFAGSVSSV